MKCLYNSHSTLKYGEVGIIYMTLYIAGALEMNVFASPALGCSILADTAHISVPNTRRLPKREKEGRREDGGMKGGMEGGMK